MDRCGQPHAIDGRHNKMAMLLLVPETKLAQPIAAIIAKNGMTRLSPKVVAKIQTIFVDFETRLASDESIEAICIEMVEATGPVGAEQLTTFKYVVRGTGQTRP